MKQSEFCVKLAEQKDLTTYHYKIILYLMGTKEANQMEISRNLCVSKQNINKVFKELRSMDIILHSRTEGRNIFWKLNPKPSFQIRGQIKLDDI